MLPGCLPVGGHVARCSVLFTVCTSSFFSSFLLLTFTCGSALMFFPFLYSFTDIVLMIPSNLEVRGMDRGSLHFPELWHSPFNSRHRLVVAFWICAHGWISQACHTQCRTPDLCPNPLSTCAELGPSSSKSGAHNLWASFDSVINFSHGHWDADATSLGSPEWGLFCCPLVLASECGCNYLEQSPASVGHLQAPALGSILSIEPSQRLLQWLMLFLGSTHQRLYPIELKPQVLPRFAMHLNWLSATCRLPFLLFMYVLCGYTIHTPSSH